MKLGHGDGTGVIFFLHGVPCHVSCIASGGEREMTTTKEMTIGNKVLLLDIDHPWSRVIFLPDSQYGEMKERKWHYTVGKSTHVPPRVVPLLKKEKGFVQRTGTHLI
jgi:hypothetical protein